jgi:hypothetical protein
MTHPYPTPADIESQQALPGDTKPLHQTPKTPTTTSNTIRLVLTAIFVVYIALAYFAYLQLKETRGWFRCLGHALDRKSSCTFDAVEEAG